jgi:16S rRNA (uracil1498-N3)-methyltransferase
MIPRLYYDGELEPGRSVDLPAASSHHLTRVLRAKVDSDIQLFNGDGNNYVATLTAVANKRCTATIESVTACDNESPIHITLLQGLSRHDRMDACLQKSTELGVDTIIPVICAHSKFKLDAARIEKKMAHWQQVIISACEQSGRCIIPQLLSPAIFSDALTAGDSRCRFVLSPDADSSLSKSMTDTDDIAILIGPESGLSSDELEQAHQQAFTAISFGPRILRTETAAPAVITAIQTLWGDLV